MKKVVLEQMSVDELVNHFLALTLDQGQALYYEDNPKYNALFRNMISVEQELKSRAGDQRRALAKFLKHSNLQVRLMAALATLPVEPVQARAMLQKISDANIYPQAADARGMLRELEKGHVPT